VCLNGNCCRAAQPDPEAAAKHAVVYLTEEDIRACLACATEILREEKASPRKTA
jgi:hypothetical protein